MMLEHWIGFTVGIIVLVVIIGIVIVAFVVSQGTDLDANWRRSVKAGHDADDPACKYWAGDRAHGNRTARCYVCDPIKKPWWKA